jgi:hypothetical protein
MACGRERRWGGGGSTEDDFLRRSEHVEGEGDFILVVLQLEPADEGGEVGCAPARGMAVGGRRHALRRKRMGDGDLGNERIGSNWRSSRLGT